MNYKMLKEETEKQVRDLKNLTDQEDQLLATPTNKDELLKQNKMLEQKLDTMKSDFEKQLYEKTLDIEKQARAEMQKHAIKAALQYVDMKDPEIKTLVTRLKQLEKENSRLEKAQGDFLAD